MCSQILLFRLIVAILGASKSASFAVPTILDKIEVANPGIGLREVCLGYALVGPGAFNDVFKLVFHRRLYLH